MGEGEKGQVNILVAERDDPSQSLDVAHKIGVAKEGSLGDSCGSGCVKERSRILWFNGLGCYPEEAGVGQPDLLAFRLDFLEGKDTSRRLRLEGDELSNLWKVLLHRGRLLPQLPVRDDHDLGIRVIDDVLDLLRH